MNAFYKNKYNPLLKMHKTAPVTWLHSVENAQMLRNRLNEAVFFQVVIYDTNLWLFIMKAYTVNISL